MITRISRCDFLFFFFVHFISRFTFGCIFEKIDCKLIINGQIKDWANSIVSNYFNTVLSWRVQYCPRMHPIRCYTCFNLFRIIEMNLTCLITKQVLSKQSCLQISYLSFLHESPNNSLKKITIIIKNAKNN